jgi:hypothetical protein
MVSIFLKSLFSQRCISFLVIACVVFAFSGCNRTVTVVTNVTYFPGNATWNTATNWLVVEAKGEPGQAYSDVGPKHVKIVLLKQRKEITNYSYSFDAGLLAWTVKWTNIESLCVGFYNESTNHPIKNINFTFNPKTLECREN